MLNEIHWEVTNKCNLRCQHCLPESGRRRTGELSTKTAMAALAEFRSAGVATIYFTGGEPFSRPDMFTLLERASCLGMRVEVITNATLLTQGVVEKISRLGINLSISLDGADATTNDAVRGKGSFEKIIEALTWCRISNVPTTLYTTVSNANFARLREIGELALTYGCAGIHFSEITLGGRALEFSRELALSTEQKIKLPRIISQIAKDVFNDGMSLADEDCWVDGRTLYMSADGNVYLCSEIFQRRHDLSLGNIRSFQLQQWQKKEVSVYAQRQNICCYGSWISNRVVFISNVASGCVFAPAKQGTIETLAQLYKAFDRFYQGIEQDCQKCHDPDCMGYIWLLKKEADRLYERGVSLVQVNNGPTFIHSFPETLQGQPDLSVRYPLCSQLCRDSRKCGIHKDRPLVCHLWPIGLEMKKDGTIVWALHRDCLHTRRLEESGLISNFNCRALNIINNISPQLLEEIIETCRAVEEISSFSEGENSYSIIKEVTI